MQQIISYIKFLWRSFHLHGIHSPFVYKLDRECFGDRGQYETYQTLEEHRRSLYTDRQIISVRDFGAGSRVFKSDERQVSAIAKKAGINRKRQRLLHRLVSYLQPENMLELGTSLGMATAAMALGNPAAKMTSLEGCPETAKKAVQHFEQFGLNRIEVKNMAFDQFFSETNSVFDLVYVDGNHTKEATLRYFEELRKIAKQGSVIIFDDIHWSWEMTEAWEIIASHPEVSVSIDTFRWGLVFFRSEQEKEHFTLRV